MWKEDGLNETPNEVLTAPSVRDTGRAARPAVAVASARRSLPAYLRDVYAWAYLNPRNARFLDHEAVVSTLLFGNSGRLRRAVLEELQPGQRVLQAAHVYGRLIPAIAQAIGPDGHIDAFDIAPLQAALCRRKLAGFDQAHVRVADAADAGPGGYDTVVCFFLLHELPDAYKYSVVDALLARLRPGGKAVFVDYHAPARWHPCRGLMRQIFIHLEPFAETLWQHRIAEFASYAAAYEWRTETYFGGLYQKTVACKF